MDNISIIQAMTEERDSAAKDAQMATESVMVAYYNGRIDTLNECLAMFER